MADIDPKATQFIDTDAMSDMHPDAKKFVDQSAMPKHSDQADAEDHINPMQAIAAGALLDGPLGFGDEIAGAAGAGLNALNNQIYNKPQSLQDIMDTYKQVRDAARDVGKRAHQQHPYITPAAAIAAGLAMPMGILGDAGAAGKAAQGAEEATQAATAAEEAVPLSQKLINGAKAVGVSSLKGGGAGLATGLGQTEDIGNVKQVAKDMGLYGAGGVIFGAAMPPLAATASGTAKGAYNLGEAIGGKIFGPVKKAFKLGYNGENVVGKEAAKAAGEEVANVAGEVAQIPKAELDRLGSLKRKILAQAQQMGMKIDPDKMDAELQKVLAYEPQSRLEGTQSDLERLKELVRRYTEGTPVRKTKQVELPSQIQEMGNVKDLKVAEQKAIESGIDPADIETVYEPLDEVGPNGPRMAAVIRQKMYKTDPDTGEKVEAGFKKLASRRVDESDMPNLKTQTELVRDNPADLTDPVQADQLRQDLAQVSSLGQQPLNSPEIANLAGRRTTGVRDLIRETRPQLEKVDDAISSLKQSAEAIGINDTRNLDESAIKTRIMNLINNEGKINMSGVKARDQINNFIENLERVNPKMAKDLRNEFGRLYEKMDIVRSANKELNFLSPLSSARGIGTALGNKLGYSMGQWTKMPREALSQVADRIATTRTDKASQIVGNTLNQASQKDERGKNAVLFGLMQNPAYRQILREYIPIKDEDQDEGGAK